MRGRFFVGIAAVFLAAACGSSSSKKAPAVSAPVVRDFFVHGDPSLLLTNTTSDEKSFFSDEVFSAIEGRYELISLTRFSNRSEREATPVTQGQIERENAANDGGNFSPLLPFSFSSSGATGRYVPNPAPSEKMNVGFDFVRGADSLWH